ncbi:MAG: hypothetical protein GY701_17645 [Sulfitobacter sp.]|nr:hypothetical protein [Sulfitobacter sp.]
MLGAFPLLELSYRNLGSGDHCHGIGFGCNLEREEDALLVTGTYLLTLFAALVTRSAFRSRVSAPTFFGLTVIAIAVALGPTTIRYRAERPYWVLQGPTAESLGDAQHRVGLVTADLRTLDDPQLDELVEALEQTPPKECFDQLDRGTGKYRFSLSATGPKGFDDLSIYHDDMASILETHGFAPGDYPNYTADGFTFELDPDYYRFGEPERAYRNAPTGRDVRLPTDSAIRTGDYNHWVEWSLTIRSPCLTP